jgi:hypothetical protein
MKKNTNEKIKKSESAVVPQTTAGAMLAASWAYGTTGLELVQDINSIIVALANIDFSDTPGCKNVQKTATEEDTGFLDELTDLVGESVQAIPGCSPIASAIAQATEDPSPSNVANSALAVISELLSTQDRFPACAVEQYRNFLSVLPIQYYLLVLLSKLAKNLPILTKDLEKQIETPCGTSLQQIQTFESRLPQLELPLIPELPYINIPDVSDILKKLVHELLCISICAATSPIIKRVSNFFLSVEDSWTEAILGEDGVTVTPLKKVSVNPFIPDSALVAAKANKLIPSNIPNQEIRDYLTKIQMRPDIGQEEFIFLFLGQVNCNIVVKIQDIPETSEKFELNDDQQIIKFFTFLGSFIAFMELIEQSRATVCNPDPCALKPDELDGVLNEINNLCQLLNPEFGLPKLPLGAIMEAVGANDFIVDNTHDGYISLANSNGQKNAYNFDGKVENYVEPYIQAYVLKAVLQADSVFKLKQNPVQRKALTLKAFNFMGVAFPFMYNEVMSTVDSSFSNSVSDYYPQEDIQLEVLPPNDDFRGVPRNNIKVEQYVKYLESDLSNNLRQLQANNTVLSPGELGDQEKFEILKKEFGI